MAVLGRKQVHLAWTALAGPVVNPVRNWLSTRWAAQAMARRSIQAGPVTVAGLFGSDHGIARAARLLRAGLDAALPGQVHCVDVSPLLGGPGDALACKTELDRYRNSGTLVTVLNPPELLALQARLWGKLAGSRLHIGCWVWETASVPEHWYPALGLVDRIWAPAASVEDALVLALQRRNPGRPAAGPAIDRVPYPVAAASSAVGDREAPTLWPASARLKVLAAFDVRSSLARKNPAGAIQAYCSAFEPGSGTCLVLKVSGADADPERLRQLQTLTRSREDIIWCDSMLSDAAVWTLFGSCDVLLSLHRAEGFGLSLAEAALLGKLVIASTGSGCMDVLAGSGGVAAVGGRAVPVQDPQQIYRGGHWLEPDCEQAAAYLRRALEDRQWRTDMGDRARAVALDAYSVAAFGKSPAVQALAAQAQPSR